MSPIAPPPNVCTASSPAPNEAALTWHKVPSNIAAAMMIRFIPIPIILFPVIAALYEILFIISWLRFLARERLHERRRQKIRAFLTAADLSLFLAKQRQKRIASSAG